MKKRDTVALFVFDNRTSILGLLLALFAVALAAAFDPPSFLQHMHLIVVGSLLYLFALITFPCPVDTRLTKPSPGLKPTAAVVAKVLESERSPSEVAKFDVVVLLLSSSR